MGYRASVSILGLAVLASCAPSRVTDGFRARSKSNTSVSTIIGDLNGRPVSRSKETFGAQPRVDPAHRSGGGTSSCTAVEAPVGLSEDDPFRAKAKLHPAIGVSSLVRLSEVPKAAVVAEFPAKTRQTPGSNEPVVLSCGPVASSLQGELKIHFIQVGQGDCTLVQCPNGTNTLIDCGSLHENKPVKAYIEDEVDANGRIDSVVVSHPDADHYNYSPYVLGGLSSARCLWRRTAMRFARPPCGFGRLCDRRVSESNRFKTSRTRVSLCMCYFQCAHALQPGDPVPGNAN